MSDALYDAAKRSDAVGRIGAGTDRGVGWWLVGCAGLVFAMTVIGAITRLTESGLSMVEWRPLIGALPPLSDAEWQRVFDLYRQTPEYRLINAGMSLSEFKEIFFWEWLHRLWGRLIGVAYALPLAVFWVRGSIGRRLRPRLLILLVLGGAQGVLGWYMVASGLVDRPSVSHYRLAAHLGLALVIFALLVWTALDILARTTPAARPGHRLHGTAVLGLVAVTIVWGAFVAGLDAGLLYNSWPLMGGQLVPAEAFAGGTGDAVDDRVTIQFLHRWLGMVALVGVLSLAWRSRNCDPSTRLITMAAAGTAFVQVGLGIATLIAMVPVALGALHQAGAVILLALLITLLWRLSGGSTPST